MNARYVPGLLGGLAVLAGCGSGLGEDAAADRFPPVAREVGDASHFELRRVADGLVRPTWVDAAPGDPNGLWVAEQSGRLVRLQGARREVVADLRAEVKLGGEQGLLGVAFHPDFAVNRRLFLHWTDRRGDTRVAEFRVRRDGRVDPPSRRALLAVDRPEENHNGGQLAFGPDGRLYVALGDGGGAFDPRRAAQDLDSLLGKILAADVDRTRSVRWATVLYGLRNPWRFSFDSALTEIWVADVGQDEFEEVNRVPLELDEPPKNLGWSAYEGTRPIDGRERQGPGEVVWPVIAYGHDDGNGCSVTGGVVYRGSDLPALSGRYVFGDFCSGIVWTVRPRPDGRVEDLRRERTVTVPQLTHIGTDNDGELLFTTHDGDVFSARPLR